MQHCFFRNDFRCQVALNIGIRFIPYLIILISGVIRYLAIRNDAIIGDVSYSRIMKAKLFISYLFGLIYISPVVLAFTDDKYWLYNDKPYSFLYLPFSIIWIGSAILMTVEQERRLTQARYCHQFFWTTNCIMTIILSAVSLVLKVFPKNDFAAYSFMGVEF